jgi:hypothetical protein
MIKKNFIRVQTMWKIGKPYPHEIEVWGLRQELLWLTNLGTTRVSIDLDNKLVVGDIAGNPIISRSLVLFYILLKLF